MKAILFVGYVCLTGCATSMFDSQSALITQEDAKHIQCSTLDLVGMHAYISQCEKVPEYKAKSNSYCFDRALIALCGSKKDAAHKFIDQSAI